MMISLHSDMYLEEKMFSLQYDISQSLQNFTLLRALRSDLHNCHYPLHLIHSTLVSNSPNRGCLIRRLIVCRDTLKICQTLENYF